MAALVRMARESDLDALFALSALTGGGMTNLPNDRTSLAEKVAWSERSVAAAITAPNDEFYMLVLEDEPGGRVIGTASIYSRLGARWPFYSYKISRVTHVSHDLERSFSTQVLHLVNDFDGASEVGGLFVHPEARTGGNGALLARSRYMFIARHRQRFGDRVVAELRGWMQNGISPFWEAVGKPFFGGDFFEADRHNALHGNQFIADLMPRYPIYVTMLPAPAQEAIGKAHENSVPAQKMLEAEGFAFDGYIDIFDAGPTVSAATDQIRTIRECREVDGVLLSGSDPGLRAEDTSMDFTVRYE